MDLDSGTDTPVCAVGRPCHDHHVHQPKKAQLKAIYRRQARGATINGRTIEWQVGQQQSMMPPRRPSRGGSHPNTTCTGCSSSARQRPLSHEAAPARNSILVEMTLRTLIDTQHCTDTSLLHCGGFCAPELLLLLCCTTFKGKQDSGKAGSCSMERLPVKKADQSESKLV